MADCPESGGWHEVPEDDAQWAPLEQDPRYWSEGRWAEAASPLPEVQFSYPPTEDELIEALGHLRAAAAMLRDRADMELAVSKALTYGTLPLEIAAYLTLEAE